MLAISISQFLSFSIYNILSIYRLRLLIWQTFNQPAIVIGEVPLFLSVCERSRSCKKKKLYRLLCSQNGQVRDQEDEKVPGWEEIPFFWSLCNSTKAPQDMWYIISHSSHITFSELYFPQNSSSCSSSLWRFSFYLRTIISANWWNMIIFFFQNFLQSRWI